MKIIQTLQAILPLLNQTDADWCVFSSAARWLDGEDVTPHDIDIMMSLEGAERAEKLLAPWRVWDDQKESGVFRSRRSHYIIEGTEIDLSGGLEKLIDGEWMPVVPQQIKVRQGIRYLASPLTPPQ